MLDKPCHPTRGKISELSGPIREKWDRVVSKGRSSSLIERAWSNGGSWNSRMKSSCPLGNLAWVEWYRGNILYSVDFNNLKHVVKPNIGNTFMFF